MKHLISLLLTTIIAINIMSPINMHAHAEEDTASKYKACTICNGTGFSDCEECKGTGLQKCEECRGNGTIREICSNCGGDGREYSSVSSYNDLKTWANNITQSGFGYEYDCVSCRGKGYINRDCPSCSGVGYFGGSCEMCNGTGKIECLNCKGTGIAEHYNYSLLKNLKGYEYDDFAQEWNCCTPYYEYFSDAKVTISFNYFGQNGGNGDLTQANINAIVYDIKNYRESSHVKLSDIQKLTFEIDGVKYTFNDIKEREGDRSNIIVIGGEKGFEYYNALLNANEIVVYLSLANGINTSFDIDMKQFTKDIKPVLQVVIDSRMWDYYNCDPDLITSLLIE